MRGKKRILLAVAGLLLAGLRAGANDRPRSFTAIDYPGAVATTAFGVNAQRDVVGSYTDSSNKTHGFVRIGELFRSVDFPGAAFTQARGISPAGEIVGSYRLPGEPSVNFHGYLLTRGGK